MRVKVLAFGPIAEILGGRHHETTIPPNSSIRFLMEELELDVWLNKGIVFSINGETVSDDQPLFDGDEIALLPPVSGG
ncbi:MAG: MoaD/ThiS family protein [Candidatus Poseidoniaceae archaeon]|jgi:molybdopterin converting factor small subunit|nr:MoaD/ThiS family protein [Candidatus Poseidoniaceae archaeon]